MFINRGNHETKEMNRTYGFEGEAKHKHGEQTYKVRLRSLPFLQRNVLFTIFHSCSPTYSRQASISIVLYGFATNTSRSALGDPHMPNKTAF